MQVSMIENWADVTGVVRDIRPSSLPDHSTVELEVQSVKTVDAFPNLLNQTGGTILVNIRAESLGRASLQRGDRVEVRVRRGGPDELFAHPDFTRRV